jgi:hypothetical protein
MWARLTLSRYTPLMLIRMPRMPSRVGRSFRV